MWIETSRECACGKSNILVTVQPNRNTGLLVVLDKCRACGQVMQLNDASQNAVMIAHSLGVLKKA